MTLTRCYHVTWGGYGRIWTRLKPEEQQAIAALGAGLSIQVCNEAALIALKRAGLIRGRHLTLRAKQLRKDVVLRTMAA